MIVLQFISWVRTAPSHERAEATRALARAWLFSDLPEPDRNAAEGALLSLLDDVSPQVRRAMSEAFAHSEYAPEVIVRALAADQPSVALPILEYSPLMLDADLIEIVASDQPELQCAIARREDLTSAVAAAIAEVGSAAAALELIENRAVQLPDFSWDRIVERHGHLAAIREAMLEIPGLPAATRLTLVGKLSDTLGRYVVMRNWLPAARAEHVIGEATARSTVNIAAQTEGEALAPFVSHLRESGKLTVGLVLRALLSGNFELFLQALVELTGFSHKRIAGLLDHASDTAIDALLARAGLPEATFGAFRAALAARNDVGFSDSWAEVARLQRRMVERAMSACETQDGGTGSVLKLLRRFATEAAREDARVMCETVAIKSAMAPFYQRLASAA